MPMDARKVPNVCGVRKRRMSIKTVYQINPTLTVTMTQKKYHAANLVYYISLRTE